MSERGELVARLRTIGLPTARNAADQIERDGREIDRLREALTRVANYRAAAHAYDDDVGHMRRCFDIEDVIRMENIARAALNGEARRDRAHGPRDLRHDRDI